MLRSSFCDYSGAYILVSGTITVVALEAGGGNNNIQVVFKDCAPIYKLHKRNKKIHKWIMLKASM